TLSCRNNESELLKRNAMHRIRKRLGIICLAVWLGACLLAFLGSGVVPRGISLSGVAEETEPVQLSCDGRYLCTVKGEIYRWATLRTSGAPDPVILAIWDIEKGCVLAETREPDANGIWFSRDGLRAGIYTPDGLMRTWNSQDSKTREILPAQQW